MMFPSSLVWLNPSTSPFLIPRPHSGHSAPGGSCGASAGARLATLGRQPRFAEWFTNSPGAGAVVVIGWLAPGAVLEKPHFRNGGETPI